MSFYYVVENDVKCNNSNGCESSCPPDSKIGSDGKCVCSYDKCPLSPANCNEGYVKKRVHESTEIPGECCSIDDCVKEICELLIMCTWKIPIFKIIIIWQITVCYNV